MTAFDVSERRIWDGRAESYARTFTAKGPDGTTVRTLSCAMYAVSCR
ncbi:hypothetical protein ACIBO4_14445 [Streptomyces sp. NPDC050149]